MGLAIQLLHLNIKKHTFPIISFSNVMQDLGIVIARKWRGSRQNDMQQHSHGPNIASFIIIFRNYFWSNIIRCSNKFVLSSHNKLLSHILIPLIGESKIYERKLVLIYFVEQKILSLQVPMTNFL